MQGRPCARLQPPTVELGSASEQLGEAAIGYRFNRDDHDVIDALRRVAAAQLDGALSSAEAGAEPGAIHDIRKRLKKLRGLIRLVRPVFPEAKAENRTLRNAGRRISGLRDAEVLLGTHDRLVTRPDAPGKPGDLKPLREHLAGRATQADPGEGLGEVQAALVAMRGRIDRWDLSETGFDAVAGGLRETYRAARNGPDGKGDHAIHAWRKPVKYHGYHVRLLRNLWPEHMQARSEALHEMGEALGEHHDLSVYAETAATGPLEPPARKRLLALAAEQKSAAETRARELGALLFTDKPKVMVARWEAWWDLWRG